MRSDEKRRITIPLRPPEVTMAAAIAQARREAFEEAAKVVEALESPFDHHTHTPQDCAYSDALEAAAQSIRSLATPGEG